MKQTNRLKSMLLSLAALGLLAACSAEQPEAGRTTGGDSASGQTLTIDLAAEAPSYNDVSYSEPEDVASESKARSWNDTQGFPFKVVDATSIGVSNSEGDGGDRYRLQNGRSKVAKVDQETLLKENPRRDILLMIRKAGNNDYVYYQSTWSYNGHIKAYELKNGQITVPASWGTLTGSEQLYARVITGAKYDETAKTLEVDEHLSELDLRTETTLKARVPFASDWVALRVDTSDGRLYIAQKNPHDSDPTVAGTVMNYNNRMKFKPLGMLILFSFRNTSPEQVTFPAIRVLTNQLLFAGKYDLRKEALECEAPDAETESNRGYKIYDMPYTGDRYREKIFTLSSPLTLASGSSSNRRFADRVFVAWAAPVPSKRSIQSRDMPAFLGGTIEAAQTMVFGMNVTDRTGAQIKYPNYVIAPVMGTNRALENGKTYAMNCEFYTGARPILGYYAQYTVNAAGTGFDRTHNNADVSLLHYSKARDFVGDGKSLPRPDGTGNNVYHMGSRGSASLLTLLFGIPFNYNPLPSSGSSYNTLGASEYRARNPIAFPSLVLRGRDYIIQDQTSTWYHVMYSRRTPYDGVTYSLIGRPDGGLLGGSNRTGPMRSNSQAVYRIEATGFAQGRLEQVKIKSFATGKYYVGGTYTPIYQGKSIMDENLWNDEVVLQGGWAERIIPAPGNFTTVAESDYQADQPANTGRGSTPGTLTAYWFDMGFSTNYLMYWANGNRSGASLTTTEQTRRIIQREATVRGTHFPLRYRQAQLSGDFPFNQTFVDALVEEQNYMNNTQSMENGTLMLGGSVTERRPSSVAGYRNLDGANVTVHTLSIEAQRAFLWQALLPYSTTYQGESATVPSHEAGN